MRRLAFLCVLLATSVASAEDRPGATHLAATLHAEPASVVPGQAFEVWLQIRWAPDHFKRHAAPLFREAMSLPVQVTWPWLEKPEGVVMRPAPAPAADLGESFVLNGAVVRGLPLGPHDGLGDAMDRTWIQRTCLAEQTGTLTVPGATLRYAYADTFEEGFLGERVAVDPRFVTLTGEALTVTVRPFPEPVARGFTGAVGTTAVEARLDRPQAQVGEPLRLTLTFRGADNLARFDPPSLDDLDGFEVRGVDDDRATPLRSIVYELVPRTGGATQVPPIRFAYFAPQLPHGGQYVVVHTRPLPLRVAGGAAPAPESTDEAEPVPDRPLWPYAVFGAIAGAVAVLVVGRARRRRAAGAAPEPPRDEARVAAARDALRAQPGERTLTAFLAACLDCGAPAVLGPGLAARLEEAGVAPALAARTEEALVALVAARYGGAPATLDPALVTALQSALTT